VQPVVSVVCGSDRNVTVWNHAAFSLNRERLLNEEIAESLFQQLPKRSKPYMSDVSAIAAIARRLSAAARAPARSIHPGHCAGSPAVME
jgi:hypothetical protein